jgi:ligand-binding SRPBCC domain-containing protein
MKLRIRTSVHQSYQQVWAGFDRNLFLLLNPPFPPVKVLRFDGCHKGDEVHLELNFLLFRQVWKSNIVDQQMDAEEIYFVDEGFQLPFFLKYWRHRHRILRRGNQAEIVDDISFRTPFFLFDYLLYPVMYLQFAYRKPIYRKVFG